MTDKDLRRLSRAELLELMVSLSEENETLHNQIDLLRGQLADRVIQLQDAGSVAEAAIRVSGVFEAAQDAADRYLLNIRTINDNAQKNADGMIEEARRKCAAIEAETQRQADMKWNSIKQLLDHYCETHKELEDQIASLYGKCEKLKDNN